MEGRRDGEPTFGQLQRRSDHLLEAHGAVQLDGRQPSIGGRRGNRSHDPFRQVAVDVVVVVVDAGGLGPNAQSADGHRFPSLGVVQDDGSHPAETRVLGQRHVDYNPGGYPGVGGVSALLQDAVARGRGQVMSRRDHVGGAGYQGPVASESDSHNTPPVRVSLDLVPRHGRCGPESARLVPCLFFRDRRIKGFEETPDGEFGAARHRWTK